VRPGRVHHSDRGVHYAPHVYIDPLKAHGIRISMSRRGHPYDNTQAESFIKTLKCAAVSLWEYQNLVEARGRLSPFMEHVYHAK
jgi:putative transposase